MSSNFDFQHFFETYRSAVFDRDVDRLLSLYGKDFAAFDTWVPWSHVGEGPWRNMNRDWLSSLGSESVVVDFDDIRLVQGSDVAAAYATMSFKAVSDKGDVLRSMQNRLTWVAEPQDGAWKIVHQHTSVPIDSDTMSPVLRR